MLMSKLPPELAAELQEILDKVGTKLKNYEVKSKQMQNVKEYSKLIVKFDNLRTDLGSDNVRYEDIQQKYGFFMDRANNYIRNNPEEEDKIRINLIVPIEEGYQKYRENLAEEKLRLIEACNQFYLAIVDRIDKEGFDDNSEIRKGIKNLFNRINSFIEFGTNKDFEDLYPLKEKVISKYDDYIQAMKRVEDRQIPSTTDSEGWDKNWDSEDDADESKLRDAESSQNKRKIANYELSILIPRVQQYLRTGLNYVNISTIREAYDKVIDAEPRLVQVLGEENPDIIKLRGLLLELYDNLILFMKNSEQVDEEEDNDGRWDKNLKSEDFEETDKGSVYEEFKNLKK